VVATLLDLLTPELTDGLRAFLASCQTYEGGFSAASQPYFSASPPSASSLLPTPRPSLGEAHGGYTFCGLASLILLEPVSPPSSDPRKWMGIDVKNLYRWAASMQGLDCEGGGFKGRTNKLVDGCYSWWVGGLFPLLDDVLDGGGMSSSPVKEEAHREDSKVGEEKTSSDASDWADHDESLFNRDALQEFILISSQSPQGGLRDKPGRPADAYHTLYNLSGLSSAQHRVHRTGTTRDTVRSAWIPKVGEEEPRRRDVFVSSMAWVEDEPAARYVGGKGNRVNATHPVFDLTISASKAMMEHFYGQTPPDDYSQDD